ncbi:diguanylate cyclase (GGDEF)-like protein [Undibacterium sp. GrIS 1.2]|uniref:tetratricopeptide repeat-containing diguanylate cyclase n=1 Tax=Undibacterium sp. GrIS 1.2 TaxID=3143933 RepID=UPI003391F891
MNQSILLLPHIDRFTAKLGILQSATSLLLSLRAYDDALSYANRMLDIPSPEGDFQAKCIGYTNQVQINFERGNRLAARSAMKDALDNCNANGRKGIVLILQVYEVVDLIDTGSYQQGIRQGVILAAAFSKSEQGTDDFSKLLEALSRAYLKTGQLDIAESYSLRALQLAKINQSIQLMAKLNTTMSAIKRAQGQYASALDYYDMSLALKDKILDEQLRKNIAYQRVQFDSKDKANQLVLLEEKNKALMLEQQLERRNNLVLVFLMVAITCLMMSILFWLMKTLKQKNLFRQFSQIDGLTQVANRTHFIHCATEAFDKNPNGMSIILFDMDLFKKVNDTYGHATGDWVLKNVTEVVQAQLRDVDLLGRLGGEEFAICMPDSTVDTAMALAERCRAAIAVIDTVTSGHQFDLSASFGVSSFFAGPERSFKVTLEAADRALYHAKSQGRNCVSAHY